MADVTVQVMRNGPLVVKGPVQVLDADGKPVPPKEGATSVALCRCGQSRSKPLCDGSHRAANFQG